LSNIDRVAVTMQETVIIYTIPQDGKGVKPLCRSPSSLLRLARLRHSGFSIYQMFLPCEGLIEDWKEEGA